MSISCECWDGWPEFLQEHERTARKEHRCSECRVAIKPGDSYRVITGVWEGTFDTFKHCEKCADLWDSMIALGFCLEYGNLIEDHQDYIDEYNPPRITA